MNFRSWPLHPFLLVCGFILGFALASDVEPTGFIRPLLVAAGATALALAVAWLVVRDLALAALLVTGALLILLTIVPAFHLATSIGGAFGPGAGSGAAVVGLLIALTTPILLVLWLRRKPQRLAQITGALNTALLVLLAIVIVSNAGPDIQGMLSRPATQGGYQGSSTAQGPDIYVILLDGYPRADVLGRRFNIDNSPFLDQLRARDFGVADGSHSNYVFTQLTLASMFQMRHLEQVPAIQPRIGSEGGQNGLLRAAICDGAAFATLREHGYEIVSTAAGYEHAALRCIADRVLDHGEMTDLERTLLERTWIPDLLAPLWPALFSGPQRDRIVHTFADLRQLAAEQRDHPIFAFGHIPAPHLPLVLAADGRVLELSPRDFDASNAVELGISEREFADLYASELRYLNSQVVATIDEITNSSVRMPVIVVMSDHGYTYDPGPSPDKFGNLLAWATPGAPDLLGGDVTPVNYFSLLLNRYLGTQIAISERRFFYSPGPSRQLMMTEVGDPDAPDDG